MTRPGYKGLRKEFFAGFCIKRMLESQPRESRWRVSLAFLETEVVYC